MQCVLYFHISMLIKTISKTWGEIKSNQVGIQVQSIFLIFLKVWLPGSWLGYSIKRSQLIQESSVLESMVLSSMSAIWKSWERRTRKSKKITGQARETFLFFFAWHPGGHQCPILYQFYHKTLRQMLEPLLEQESQTQLMLLFFFTL